MRFPKSWIQSCLLATLLAVPAASPAACPGDCDGDGIVESSEMASGLLAALALGLPCEALDADASGVVTVTDLVAAAEHARRGCRLADCAFGKGALPADTLPPGSAHGSAIPIDHVLVVMMENRSFDHYLGTLDHPDVDGIPPRFANPDASGTPVPAFHQTDLCTSDVAHEWAGSHEVWNGGRNDGFVLANNPGGARAMAYYDAGDIAFHHALARSYATCDRFFCDLLGPTFPNRYYLYCGTSFGKTANDVNLQGWTQRTIFDALDERGLSWRIYSEGLHFGAVFQRLRSNSSVKPLSQYFADAAAGNLPAVAFLDPAFTGVASNPNDDHPPTNIQRGQAFLASLVNALTASPQWPSSALFWTYDEHGGFFDHVPPPQACIPDDKEPELAAGDPPGDFDILGFRVPFVAVSPWVRAGHVSHAVHSNASILRFIETRFDLPALSARDANAQALLDLFDFSAPALLVPPSLPAATIDPDRNAASCP